MQIMSIEDKIASFLDKKFRYSKSFLTKRTYAGALNRFQNFLQTKYNLDLNQVILKFEAKTMDPLDVLDEYFTFLSNYKRENGKIGFGNSTIIVAVTVAKEFLNSQNLHIYNEDLKQKFRMPKKQTIFEEGLTKEILVRVLHNSSPKLQMAVLFCASGGTRIGELVQLKISDIDFTTNPTTIHLRRETTKTRESRFTCITAEATKLLKDYLRRNLNWSEGSKDDKYIFLNNDRNLGTPEEYDRNVSSAKCTLVQALLLVVKSVPELAMKNENGRNNIHFHAFRAWFKTQVTNAHQSDFAEALMGHKSIKLVYFRQNQKDRLKTYLEVEPALTVSDFTRFEKSVEDLKTELESGKAELKEKYGEIEILKQVLSEEKRKMDDFKDQIKRHVDDMIRKEVNKKSLTP